MCRSDRCSHDMYKNSQKFLWTEDFENWTGTMGAKFDGTKSSVLSLIRALSKNGKKLVEQGTAGHTNPLVYTRGYENGNRNVVGHLAVNCVVWLECFARKLEEVDVRFRPAGEYS